MTLTYYTDEYIQIGLTLAGNFTGNKGTFNTLAVLGSSVLSGESSWKPSSHSSRGVFIGLDSVATGGIDIVADSNQYIDFTTTNNDFRGRVAYNTTNNDLKICMLMGAVLLL